MVAKASSSSSSSSFDPIKVVKVLLTVAIVGAIVFFAIKYRKWFEAGAGLLAVAAAGSFLLDIVAGLIGSVGAVGTAVAAVKKVFKKAEADKASASTPEELKDIDLKAKNAAKAIGEAVEGFKSSIQPGSTFQSVTFEVSADGTVKATVNVDNSASEGDMSSAGDSLGESVYDSSTAEEGAEVTAEPIGE